MSRAKKSDKGSSLPKKFTQAERYAYDWLYDCGVRGWLVDLITKQVHSVDNNDVVHKHKSLVDFAKLHGMEVEGE